MQWEGGDIVCFSGVHVQELVNVIYTSDDLSCLKDGSKVPGNSKLVPVRAPPTISSPFSLQGMPVQLLTPQEG